MIRNAVLSSLVVSILPLAAFAQEAPKPDGFYREYWQLGGQARQLPGEGRAKLGYTLDLGINGIEIHPEKKANYLEYTLEASNYSAGTTPFMTLAGQATISSGKVDTEKASRGLAPAGLGYISVSTGSRAIRDATTDVAAGGQFALIHADPQSGAATSLRAFGGVGAAGREIFSVLLPVYGGNYDEHDPLAKKTYAGMAEFGVSGSVARKKWEASGKAVQRHFIGQFDGHERIIQASISGSSDKAIRPFASLENVSRKDAGGSMNATSMHIGARVTTSGISGN